MNKTGKKVASAVALALVVWAGINFFGWMGLIIWPALGILFVFDYLFNAPARRQRKQRIEQKQCVACGGDLRGVSNTDLCPHCGEGLPRELRTTTKQMT